MSRKDDLARLRAQLTDPNEPDWFDEACKQKAEMARRREAVEALADEWADYEWPGPLGVEIQRVQAHTWEAATKEHARVLREALAPVVPSGEAESAELTSVSLVPVDESLDDWPPAPIPPGHRLTEYGTTDCPVDGVRAGVDDDGACEACGAPVSSGGQTDEEGEASTIDLEVVIGALDNLARDCRATCRFDYATVASTLADHLRSGRLHITGTAARPVLSREALTARFGDFEAAVAEAVEGMAASLPDSGPPVTVQRCYATGIAQAALAAVADVLAGEQR